MKLPLIPVSFHHKKQGGDSSKTNRCCLEPAKAGFNERYYRFVGWYFSVNQLSVFLKKNYVHNDCN